MILFVIWLIFIILGFIFKKNRMLTFSMLFFIFILYGWSSGNADFHGYETRYQYYDSELYKSGIEIGYYLILKFFNLVGMSFRGYMICNGLFIAVMLALTNHVAKTKVPNYVYACYMIFPLCMNVVTMRFAVASAIALLAVAIMISKFNNGTALSIILVCISATIHVGCLFFLVFVFAERIKWKYMRIVLWCSSIVAATAVFVPKILTWILGLLPDSSIKRVVMIRLKVASGHYDTIDVVVMTGEILFIVLISLYMFKVIDRGLRIHGIDKSSILGTVEKYNKCMFLLVPFSVFIGDLFRVQMVMLVFTSIAVGEYLYLVGYSTNKRKVLFVDLKVLIMPILISFCMLFLWVLRSSVNIVTVFRPLFEKNVLFY